MIDIEPRLFKSLKSVAMSGGGEYRPQIDQQAANRPPNMQQGYHPPDNLHGYSP